MKALEVAGPPKQGVIHVPGRRISLWRRVTHRVLPLILPTEQELNRRPTGQATRGQGAMKPLITQASQ